MAQNVGRGGPGVDCTPYLSAPRKIRNAKFYVALLELSVDAVHTTVYYARTPRIASPRKDFTQKINIKTIH